MKYVFESKKVKRYQFPTHANDIIVDRADATVSEVFMVTIEPGKVTHFHKHDDVEQVFYMIEGEGVLAIGSDKKEFSIKPMQVVRIPPGTLHTVYTVGDKAVRYLCIDCFSDNNGKISEPTWEEHVHTICREQGYDFNKVTELEYK